MGSRVEFPALMAWRELLAARQGQFSDDEVPRGVAVLEEYLDTGALLGRSLRTDLAAMRPIGEHAAALVYLFVVTIDAATHSGREAPLLAYARSEQPLSDVAGRLHAKLLSDAFNAKTGLRPVQGGNKGCSPH